MKKNLALIFICFSLIVLTGCSNKDIKLLGTYSSGNEDDTTYFYYEFTKKGNKKETCNFYEFIEGYGSTVITYEYDIEKVDDEIYMIYLKNPENKTTTELTYYAEVDTIIDNIGTYTKSE